MSEVAVETAAPATSGPRWLLRALLTRVDLKTRLSLFIGLLLGVVLLLAVYAVLGNSKRAVQGEIDAVMRLATNLLDDQAIPAEATDQNLLPVLLSVFDHTRHLCVERGPADAAPNPRGCPAAIDDSVPDWFIAQVTTAPRELRIALPAQGGERRPVIVRSDPADEILEAWNEARPLLLLIVAIGFLTNAIVVFSVWRALKPIDLIRDALSGIGRGELHPGLPKATTPELKTIIDGVVELGLNLEQARSDNQRLLRHSLEVQERERRAIARELHDEIGQSLAAMDAEAALLHQKVGSAIPELSVRTQGIRAGIATLYDGLHLLLARLRPAGLDEFGLGPTLESLVADWSGRCPQIRFEVRIEIERIAGESLVQVYLYRIAQEALINATRHARARRISVMLCEDVNRAVHLRISDDGCGLPAALRFNDAAEARRRAKPDGERIGLGLLGMIERAETLGASLAIDSLPGEGTTISLRLPQQDEA
ncbi:ATP-binding protein [Nevskia sp.]|uniref:sensor histidine kinase n=1 Tax=Nevskia sp. TaxID=1929292 RepID=UPI0025DB8505|nr:ATP-binding protein [Nevskia sp.]